ncbi:hypothetical protein [Aestuariivirga sp.]|uniref:hypothetical protein n=1 Tax=Aestuariivirga sp. TaxID=2650926 RepID=UPI00391D94AF
MQPSVPIAIALLGLVLSGCADIDPEPLSAAPPAPQAGAGDEPFPAKGVLVRNDRGGKIIEYALTRAKWKAAGTPVRFSGDCASACTLYLALPPEQVCLEPSARFKFHAPRAASAEAKVDAAAYLFENYPPWVQDWITARGGLRRNFLTMDYDYASRFLPSCGATRAADREALEIPAG